LLHDVLAHPFWTYPSAPYIWAAGLLFGVSHSLLATQMCRQYAARLGIRATSYRLYYSLLATLLTALWLWMVHALPDAPLYALEGGTRIAFFAMQAIGIGIILLSFRAFNAAIFLGLKNMPETGEPFVEKGIYRHMRHPMYSGFMLLLLASPVQSMNSLHLSLAVCAYFIIGSLFEEHRMQLLHPSYDKYRRCVPAFFPRIPLFQRNTGMRK